MRAVGLLAPVLGIVALSPPAFADASWPALFRKAAQAAEAAGAPVYDFAMETTGDTPGVTKGRIDFTRKEGDRVTILSSQGGREPDPGKIDARMEKNLDPEIWCDSLLSRAAGPVTDAGAAAGGREFRFTPKAGPDADKTEAKMYSQLQASAVIDEATGVVKSFRAVLPKPYKPAVVAKIEKLEIDILCDVASNGRPFMSRMTTRIAGSAVGRSFAGATVQTITNLRPG